MIKQDINVTQDGSGNIVGIENKITTNTMEVQELAAIIRNLPKWKRESFGKECRVVGVIPMYSPDGAFDTGFTAMNADKDQLDWLLKTFPQFSTK